MKVIRSTALILMVLLLLYFVCLAVILIKPSLAIC